MIVNQEDAAATAVRQCRLNFLRAAAKHPKINLGDSLRKKVFEPGRQYWAELGLPIPQRPSQEWSQDQDEALPLFSARQAELIENWAAHHNLNYEWVHEAARDALSWETFSDEPFSFIPGYNPPAFIWIAWYEGQSEQDYRKRVLGSFRRQLDRYIEGVTLQRGRFLNHRFSLASHYRWAAEHVCLGRGFSEIARKAQPERTKQAIRQAVLPLLKRIAIPLRDNPPKTK